MLDILEVILNHGGEADIAYLSKMTGLHQSTIRRFAATLVKRGYLFQNKRGGEYSFGIKFLQFTDTANAFINIKENALPYLKKLCDDTSETVTLAVLDRTEMIDIAMVGEEHTLRVVPNKRQRLPLHCTAIGRVFLAYMPNDRMNSYIDTIKLHPYTNKTITDKSKLKQELEKIKGEGIAFLDEEYEIGLRSAAAPVWGQNGNLLACVAIVVATSRMDESRTSKLVPKLKNCAHNISRSMGYSGK